jgi:hypothetical protein
MRDACQGRTPTDGQYCGLRFTIAEAYAGCCRKKALDEAELRAKSSVQ